jgi:acyl-coenzyme A thioesterase PaaI-like protein
VSEASDQRRWVFGESPLVETTEFAEAVRDLMSAVLSLERPSTEVRELTNQLRAAQQRLAGEMPADLWPRVGADARPEQRVYLDHSRDVGRYNACFPDYEMSVVDERGEGTVEFPLLYEGPPGIVHGGFLALLFDCVLQQLNCDLGAAGKTRSLSMHYRRPAPILTPLRFTAARVISDGNIVANGELFRVDELLCQAEMHAVLGDRANLPASSPRRRT